MFRLLVRSHGGIRQFNFQLVKIYSSSAQQAKAQELSYNVDLKNSKLSDDNIIDAVAVPISATPTIDATARSGFHNADNLPKNDRGKIKIERLAWLPSPSEETGNLMSQYKKLSKFRLTSLVVITAMGGYAIAPAAFDLSTFLMCSVGTGLVSAAANSINQYHEVPFDSQMSRTKNRVLVTGQLTPLHAIGFAAASAATGLGILYFGVNGLTAALGAGNLFLYTSIYTPMKRMSILNTWVGSVVGAIPPLMGYAGCCGTLDAGAWILAGVLYAWQFPHFNALSWNLRPDYSRAGYRMMAVTNPTLCRKVALRYTVAICGLSMLAPVFDVTNIWFALETLPLNVYFTYLAYKFYKDSNSGTSRKLFRFSLIHLPALMLLFLFNKKHWFLKETPVGAAIEEKLGNTNLSVNVGDALKIVEKNALTSAAIGNVMPVAAAATITPTTTTTTRTVVDDSRNVKV